MDVHHGPEPSIQRLMTTLQAVAALHKCCEMYESVFALTLMCPSAGEDWTLKAVFQILSIFPFLNMTAK